MAAQQPTYVDSHILEELVKDKTKVPRKDYLIIDVRDADYIVSRHQEIVLQHAHVQPSKTLSQLIPPCTIPILFHLPYFLVIREATFPAA